MTGRQTLHATRLSPADGSHFFGFHDLCPLDESDRYLLCLKVDFLDRPPQRGDIANVVILDIDTGLEIERFPTQAWNFAQAARQQWWPGKGLTYTYNCSDSDRSFAVAKSVGGKTERLPAPVYSFSPSGEGWYSLNFSRLQALGGYGYVPPQKQTQPIPSPEEDGLWFYTPKYERGSLLVSISQVSEQIGMQETANDSYITHPVPSPDGKRVAFLHRFVLRDGGINTTVCVCAKGGGDLKVLASGYYSHFDWKDDETVVIWGRSNRVQALRKTKSRMLASLLRLGRPIYRIFRRLSMLSKTGSESFIQINVTTGQTSRFLSRLIEEDGHPSFFSKRRSLMVTDTYPDKAGVRSLYVVETSEHLKIDLGRLGAPLLEERADCWEYLVEAGVSPNAISRRDSWKMFFSRSGYSCDFHPRFNRSGNAVLIDSMHEGRRGIYSIPNPLSTS